MSLSRDRARTALKGCFNLDGIRRGALWSFLAELSDDKLKAMQIDEDACNDEIVGFLDREEKRSGDMILVHAPPCNPTGTRFIPVHVLTLPRDVIARIFI